MTSSTKHVTARATSALAAGLVLAGLCLTACEPGQKTTAPASPRTDVTATPGATTHDGATLAAAAAGDCNTTRDTIRNTLGPVAGQVQAPVLVKDVRVGVVETSCTYSLAPVPAGQEPDPGNAVTITRTMYPDQAALEKVPLPRLMMNPQPATGPWAHGWYSTNQLSTTAEYAIETVSGQTITRATLAVPVNTAKVEQAQEKLTAVITTQITGQ